jgi:hypothetical protein
LRALLQVDFPPGGEGFLRVFLHVTVRSTGTRVLMPVTHCVTGQAKLAVFLANFSYTPGTGRSSRSLISSFGSVANLPQSLFPRRGSRLEQPVTLQLQGRLRSLHHSPSSGHSLERQSLAKREGFLRLVLDVPPSRGLNCTLRPLQSSTRLSPGFNLFWPRSFGF